MRSRRKARESALQALYQCDTTGDWSVTAVELYFKVFHPELFLNSSEATSSLAMADNYRFAQNLINGVLRYQTFIDSRIGAASIHWSLARMARVDRNILRLATYELAFMDDIPPNVTLNEAIEVAKSFGAADSPMFINGVLDKIALTIQSNPNLVKEALRSDVMQQPKLVVNG